MRVPFLVMWCCLVVAACAGETQDLSADQLSHVVEQNQPALKLCYDAALERNPYKYEVRIQAAIHIDASGRVSAVELDQDGLPGMGKCLRETITSWVFPSAPDATHTGLPIIFQPKVVKKKE